MVDVIEEASDVGFDDPPVGSAVEFTRELAPRFSRSRLAFPVADASITDVSLIDAFQDLARCMLHDLVF